VLTYITEKVKKYEKIKNQQEIWRKLGNRRHIDLQFIQNGGEMNVSESVK
jgi:hypothetical protein